MKKKADLSISMIVIAAIALIVLIVLVLIFTGKINIFGKGLSSCVQKGGECATGSYGFDENGVSKCGPGEAPLLGTVCSKRNAYCCLTILDNE